MSKEMNLIPELRFPEFVKNGEWDEKPLKNVAKITMGSSPKSASYNENEIGLPLLQGNADIKDRLSAPRIYTSEITKECEIGDILLSVRAPVGTVAKSIHHACIGRGISAIRAEKNNSQEFVYQWLYSFESAWKNISQGGTFDAVNSDDIRNLKVPIPKPQEQQKIASCLSSLDELIAAHNDKLAALKDHKKGLLQNLFPQSGTGWKRYNDEQDGEVENQDENILSIQSSKKSCSDNLPRLRFPEFEDDGEWVEKKLGEVGEFVGGGTPSTSNPEYWDGDILWYTPTEVKNGVLNPSIRTITKEGLQNSSAKLLPVGTILITTRATIGDAAIANKECTTNQGFQSLVLKQSEHNQFWYYWIIHHKHELERRSSGSTFKEIGKTEIKIIPALSPRKQEQQKIASCLSAVDALITAQQEKIAQLQQHKKGLMQGLFPKIER